MEMISGRLIRTFANYDLMVRETWMCLVVPAAKGGFPILDMITLQDSYFGGLPWTNLASATVPGRLLV